MTQVIRHPAFSLEEADKLDAFATFFRWRRHARRVAGNYKNLRDAKRNIRRTISQLNDYGNVFLQGRAGDLRAMDVDLSTAARLQLDSLRDVGDALLAVGRVIDATTTLEERLRLISANTADLQHVEPRDGLCELILLDLEDSASRRGNSEIGPMHFCVLKAISRYITTSDEGWAAWAELFKAGKPFANTPFGPDGLPKPRPRPDLRLVPTRQVPPAQRDAIVIHIKPVVTPPSSDAHQD